MDLLTTPMNTDGGAPEAYTRASNHAAASVAFLRRFGRMPLSPLDPAATVNDVIYDRMIDPNWSPWERRLVDKETAKIEARRKVPALLAPRTLSVLQMADIGSADELFAALEPFAGMDAIAKPAHASGAATFLRTLATIDDVRWLYQIASRDYASILREMQYYDLPRKIIVESMVPSRHAMAPDDYKFHCVRGEPLLCQIDHARFGAAWSRLFRVPDFTPMHEDDGLTAPASLVFAPPEHIALMIAAARDLAAGFDYVRVDLYAGSDGVYFGEVTFTPAAALGIAPSAIGDVPDSATHKVYSDTIMTALRSPLSEARTQSKFEETLAPKKEL